MDAEVARSHRGATLPLGPSFVRNSAGTVGRAARAMCAGIGYWRKRSGPHEGVNRTARGSHQGLDVSPSSASVVRVLADEAPEVGPSLSRVRHSTILALAANPCLVRRFMLCEVP